MKDLTPQAYEYAKRVKKVNEGVIEAYITAYTRGFKDAKLLPGLELLEIIRDRYRSKHKIEQDLAYSGSTRGINEAETKEAKMHDLIESFCESFENLKNDKKDANIQNTISLISRKDGLTDVYRNSECLGKGLDNQGINELNLTNSKSK